MVLNMFSHQWCKNIEFRAQFTTLRLLSHRAAQQTGVAHACKALNAFGVQI